MSHVVADSQKMFLQYVRDLPPAKKIDLYEYITELRQNLKAMTNLNLRLRKLLTASAHISSTLIIDEALDRLVDETCDNLRCDRCSVFVVDWTNGEMWTKAARGTDEVIRLPINSGIVGSVATTGNIENIEDAYQDPRFNKTFDAKNKYKTNTILAIPIRDIDD
jgi:signal transduction protein with GAF and PtsI domain